MFLLQITCYLWCILCSCMQLVSSGWKLQMTWFVIFVIHLAHNHSDWVEKCNQIKENHRECWRWTPSLQGCWVSNINQWLLICGISFWFCWMMEPVSSGFTTFEEVQKLLIVGPVRDKLVGPAEKPRKTLKSRFSQMEFGPFFRTEFR